MPGRADAARRLGADDGVLVGWLLQEEERFRSAVEELWASDLNTQSTYPGLTTGHIVTHIARCADGYADELHEWRTGDVPPPDRDRQFPEYPGCLRPGAVLLDDAVVALRRLDAELEASPDTVPASMRERIHAQMLTELAVHLSDLDVPLSRLDEEMAAAVLTVAAERTTGDPSWPPVSVEREEECTLLLIGESGKAMAVRGDPGDVLAWLTQRPAVGAVKTPGPTTRAELPPWSCHRAFENV